MLFQFSCLAEMMPLVYMVRTTERSASLAGHEGRAGVVRNMGAGNSVQDLRAFLHRTSGCCERASSDAWKHRRKSNRPSPSVRVVCDLMSDADGRLKEVGIR